MHVSEFTVPVDNCACAYTCILLIFPYYKCGGCSTSKPICKKHMHTQCMYMYRTLTFIYNIQYTRDLNCSQYNKRFLARSQVQHTENESILYNDHRISIFPPDLLVLHTFSYIHHKSHLMR